MTTWRYQTYANARFKFSLQVPANFTKQAPPPADGDGATFQSPDHRTQLIAFGENNGLGDTAAAALKQCKSQVSDEGGRITYAFAGKTYYICTGYTSDGSIFYQRTIVYSSVEYTVAWTYPRDLKSHLDPPVQHSVASFQPGPNENG